MWLIKSKKDNESYVWANQKQDNFLKFIPNQISRLTGKPHTEKDLEFYYCAPEFEDELRMIERSASLDVEARDGKLAIVGPDGNVAKECDVVKLKRWPYEGDDLRFLGHEFEDQSS